MLSRYRSRVAAPRVSLSAMREIRGIDAALAWCARRRERLTRPALRAELAATVAELVGAVARGGEQAILSLTERFDGVKLDAVAVPPEAVAASAGLVQPDLRDAIDLAIERVSTYYRAQSASGFEVEDGDARLGMLVRPVASVGCYVPGGTAPLFSSLVMTAVPARVAGVARIVVATPPRPDGSVPPEVAYVASVVDADAVLAVGGAQAIAALAFGVGDVAPVDVVVGPGNAYVVEAKRQLYGAVGIDILAGPTETLVLADATADPRHVASDLVAQAEHGGAEPVLVTDSEPLLERATRLASALATDLPTSAAAVESLEERGTAVLVADLEEGVSVLNAFAPEHACLLVDDPWRLLGRVQNAGGVFLGHESMEALGDYIAGPSHVMPTGSTARFASFVNQVHFQKLIPYVSSTAGLLERVGAQAASMARAEGLEGHARAIESRLGQGQEDGRRG